MSNKIAFDLTILMFNLVAAKSLWEFFGTRRNLDRWAVQNDYRLILVQYRLVGGPFWMIHGQGISYHVLLANNQGRVQHVWIFSPFPALISKKNYNQIIVQWENKERSVFEIPDDRA